ncbi:SDR family oxidoreductase [bacterium]|nr:SDR family oxidoreductase [bacterium]
MSRPVAIITGGTRGIGRAATLKFASAGYAVVTCGRNDEERESLSAELASIGAVFQIHAIDLRRKESVDNLITSAVAQFGTVNLLINNAGVAPLASVDKISCDDFDDCLATNISAVFHATKGVWPIMQKQGGGTIINVSSYSSVDPFPGFQVYGASKAWVNLFTKATADEGRPHGIRTFAVALGTVETPLLRGLFPDFPVEQTLHPDDVAELFIALMQPACIHASGNTIFFRK